MYGKLEDSWFARDAAALGLRIVVTNEALTVYNRTSGKIQPPGLARATTPWHERGPMGGDADDQLAALMRSRARQSQAAAARIVKELHTIQRRRVRWSKDSLRQNGYCRSRT